jgi:hypothetical protein
MPPAPVEIDFQSGGVRDVLRAFDSIETRMERFERQSTSAATSGSRAREAGAKKEVDVRQKEQERLAKEVEKAEKAATKAAEREAAQRAKDAAKQQAESVKSAERASRERQKIAENEAMVEARVLRESMRHREQMAREATQIEERAAADRVRIAERAVQQQTAAARRAHSGYGSLTGVAGRSIGGMASAVGTLAASTVGIGGGFEVASALRTNMEFEEAVAQASNMSYIPGTTTRAQVAPDKIAALAKGVQGLTNISKTDAANAIKKYVGLSSDFEGVAGVDSSGRTGIENLAVISKASGTEFGQLVQAAASVKAGNPNMNSEQLMGTMRSLIGAGKLGTLPLDILASHIGEIQATAGRLAGGDTAEGLMANQAKLLGVAQLVGKATGGDAAEAATAIRHLTGDIAKHGAANGMTAAMIYQGGDPRKGMLAPDELLANVFKVTGGRFDLEQKVLGERSIKVADALNPVFQAAEAAQKGSGVDAVRREVQKFENVSYSKEDTQTEFKSVMGSSGERLKAVSQHFEEVVAGAATPAFEKFTKTLTEHQDDIAKVVNGLGKLAEALVDDPVGSAIKIMTAKVAADVAQAAIGNVLKEAMLKSLSGIGGGSFGGGSLPALGTGGGRGGFIGAGGALGALGAAGAIAVVATGVIEIGMSSIDLLAAKMNKENQDAVAKGLTVEGAIGGGKLGPDGKITAYSDADRKKIITGALGAEEKKEDNLKWQAEHLDAQIKAFGGHVSPEMKEQAAKAHAAEEKQAEYLRRMHAVLESIDRKTGGAPSSGPLSYAPGTKSPYILRSSIVGTPTPHAG